MKQERNKPSVNYGYYGQNLRNVSHKEPIHKLFVEAFWEWYTDVVNTYNLWLDNKRKNRAIFTANRLQASNPFMPKRYYVFQVHDSTINKALCNMTKNEFSFFNKGYIVISKIQLDSLVKIGLFKKGLNINEILRLAVYVTPQRKAQTV